MKTSVSIYLVFILIAFTQCKTVQFENNPPFKVISASFNNWSGGQPGVRGTKVSISYQAKEKIEFQSIYFRNSSTITELQTVNGETVVAGFFDTSTRANDKIENLKINKKKENHDNDHDKNPHFDLQHNEAVISYKSGDKIKYYKISGLKEVPSNFNQ